MTLLPEKPTVSGVVKSIAAKAIKQSAELFHLKSMESDNGKILTILGKSIPEAPLLWDRSRVVHSGSVFRGILLNSLAAANLQTPILFAPYPNQGLPQGSKFMCQGQLMGKRLMAQCSRLVTAQMELQVSAQLLSLDGSAGIRGIFEDGKDMAITGAILSDFTQGILQAAQSKLTTPFGQVNEQSTKNMALQGLSSSGDSVSDILLEDAKKSQGTLYVEAGSECLIYFQEPMNVQK